MSDATLSGFTVGITADRRRIEQAHLFERRGAEVLFGPTIQTVPLGADDGLRHVTEELIADPPDHLVANTGIGMREWFAAAESWGLGELLLGALAEAHVVTRGPKAGAVVHQIGLTVHDRAQTERLEEVVAILRRSSLAGRRIAFQRHGQDAAEALAPLRADGATVIEIPVYQWLTPDDFSPADRLVDAVVARRVQVVTFTSAPAVHNFMDVARRRDLSERVLAAFNDDVVAACVGPVCGEAATVHGVRAPLVPERARLGPMVRAVADDLLARRTRRFVLDDIPVVLQGTTVFLADDPIEVTLREARVLGVLADAAGGVVTKRQLLATVWGDPNADPHVVETTVGRLRTRLGPAGRGLATVPRRGYRLTATN